MPLDDFGDIRISRQISGVGLSGISVTSLSFKTSDDISIVSEAAPAVLGGIGNLPTFYVNQRTYSDGIWTVECLDRCAFLDKKIDTSNWTVTDGKYQTSAIAGGLISECGFGSAVLPSGMQTYINKECVDGQTYQTILNEISQAYCGFFRSPSINALDFVPYDQTTSGETISDYTRMHDNGTFAYRGVRVSDGKNEAIYGSSAPILDISNDFADPDNSQLYNSIVNNTFEGWSVDKAVSELADMPSLGGSLTMNSNSYRVTRASAYIAGNKLILSVGGDIPQYGEINRRGLLQQRLDNAVSVDKTYGTIKPTADKDLGFVATPNQSTV